ALVQLRLEHPYQTISGHIGDQHPRHAERHPEQRRHLRDRPHLAAELADRLVLGGDVGELPVFGRRRRHQCLHRQLEPGGGAPSGHRVGADGRGRIVGWRRRRLGAPAAGIPSGVRHSHHLVWLARSSARTAGVSTLPARAAIGVIWYATSLVSQSGAASTPRQDPSLVDMINRSPRSVSTIAWLTAPPSNTRAAPWVRLTGPE